MKLSLSLLLALACVVHSEPLRLTPGVDEVIKLSRSNVSDAVVEGYVRNWPYAFQLSADEIVYLHKEGVRDTTIATMLNHSRDLPAASALAPVTAQAPPSLPAAPAQPVQVVAPYSVPVTAPSTVTYVGSSYAYAPYYYSTPSLYFNYGWPACSPRYYGGWCAPRYYGHYNSFRPSVSVGFSGRFGHAYGRFH